MTDEIGQQPITPQEPVAQPETSIPTQTESTTTKSIPVTEVSPSPVLPSQPIQQSAHPIPQSQPFPKSFLAKALEKIQFRKRAKLDKIMKFAQEKKSITNDQVEKLLHVSDATATRYLSELVKQNRLKRTGLSQNPRYEPSGGSNGGN